MKIFDYLTRLAEKQAERRIEELKRMYPHMFETVFEEMNRENKEKPAKAMKNLETIQSHT